jgi:TonB family protein
VWRSPSSLGIVLSLCVHVSLALVTLRLPPSPFHEPQSVEIAFAVASAPARDPGEAGHGARPTDAARLRAGGGLSAQNIDSFERGAGGDGQGAAAIMLFPRADELTQQDSILNAVGVAQMQRIRTADDQATREDRRATPHPGEVPFLASGDGAHPERRPVAARDPLDGARQAPVASLAGEDAARVTRGDTERSASERGDAANAGTDRASPGRGIANGAGARESEAARVASGRPPLDPGPAATSSDWRDARVRDNQDAELLAARMVQSLADTSQHGGRTVGPGSGGVGGGGAAGSGGGTIEGGRARSFGPGGGAYDSLDTGDARYQRWFLEQVGRVDRALVFPRTRQLSMDQGTSVYRIVLRPDGTLAAPPRLLRSSGFQDLDTAALVAIERALPFARVPDALLGERTALQVTLPVHFINPLVQ